MKSFAILIVLLSAFAGLGSAWADLASDRARADAYLAAKDYKQAFRAYRDLARDGDHDAQFTLAQMYETGQGTRQDLIDAYAWAALAAEVGMPELKLYSKQVLAKIDESRKDKAKKAALKLQNKYGKEALQAKADRLATRGAGRHYGSCTGSRIACSNRVESVSISPAGGATMVGPDPAGN